MKKIAWIVDTTGTLEQEYIKEKNINVVPLNIMFGEDSYKEDIEMNAEEFYERMRIDTASPTTSQPAIGDFVNLYENLKKEYELGIAIHASGGLSGTYSSSVQAAEMAGFKLIAFDSSIGSYPLHMMIKKAVEVYEETGSIEKVEEKIKEVKEKMDMLLLPANLEQLKKSGRLSNGKAILASILKINLILQFQEGKVVLKEKVRTERKVKEYIHEKIKEISRDAEEICIIHAGNEELANKWIEELKKENENVKFRTMILCPVAGVHLGYDSICFSWIKK